MLRLSIGLTALLLVLPLCVQAKSIHHKHHHLSHANRKSQSASESQSVSAYSNQQGATPEQKQFIAALKKYDESPEGRATAADAARQDRYDEQHPGARAARAAKIHEDYLREQAQEQRRRLGY